MAKEFKRKRIHVHLFPKTNHQRHRFLLQRPENDDGSRMDLVVTYNKKEYIIELKIWHGTEYEISGRDQISEYLETRNHQEGYLVTFSFLKEKVLQEKSIFQYPNPLHWTAFVMVKFFLILRQNKIENMKQIFCILFLLLPMMLCGQSRESNKLYKQGLKLLDAEKYEEALLYFQKSDSIDKATLPQNSKNYYRAELKMADCWDIIAAINVNRRGSQMWGKNRRNP